MHEQRKLQEAKYFYEQMLKETQTRENFEHNLSAFMAAARSVLQYAYKEAKKSGGQNWYENWMSQNSILGYFKEKRDTGIHKEPVRPTRNIDIALRGSLQPSGSISIVKRDAKGNVVEAFSSPQEPFESALPEPSTLNIYHYRFADWSGPEDVLSLAELYLNVVVNLVEDGVKRGFLTPGN